VLHVASFAILASAFFRSTTAALLGTYALLAAFELGFIFVDELLLRGAVRDWFISFGRSQLVWLFGVGEGDRLGFLIRLMFCPWGLNACCLANGGVGRLQSAYLIIFLSGIPSLVLAAMCIGLARWYLVRRAFLAPSNPLLNFFKRLDRGFVWANQRYTRGVVIVKESQSLPDLQPVAWRETTKRSLGQFRYLVRIFLVLQLPLLFLVLNMLNQVGNPHGTQYGAVILGVLWITTILIVSISASSLITGERGRQTLDVLLTSPLSGRQIILEKMSSVRRLIAVCAVPLLTCILFQTFAQFEGRAMEDSTSVLNQTAGYRTQLIIWQEYLTGGVLTVCVYLPFTAWLALWTGIRAKSAARSILFSLGTLAAWCVIPAMLTIALLHYLKPTVTASLEPEIPLLLLSSPAMLIVVTETVGVHVLHPMPYLAVVINSLIYGYCWLLIRRNVLSQADQYLGRVQTKGSVKGSRTDLREIVEAAVPRAAARVAS